VLLAAGVIALGCLMGKEPSMLHENEPQGPREWRPAGGKPLNEKGKLLLLALLLVALSGCWSGCALTQSSSKITLPGGVSFTLPKDSSFDYLRAEVPFLTTNGQAVVASIVITNGSFKMNPAVIDSATARDATLIMTTANSIGQVLGQAAAASAKAAVKP
jgi:hypothetical protein